MLAAEPTGNRTMRHTHSFLAACALAVATATGSPSLLAAGAGKVEQDLIQSERDRCTATIGNDAAALSAILADNIIDVWPGGEITTKAQDLVDVKTEKTSVCEVDQMQVRVYEDAAVVVGRLTIEASGSKKRIRFTDTYVRLDGRWQVVLSAVTEIR
jgi:hypothetical protein